VFSVSGCLLCGSVFKWLHYSSSACWRPPETTQIIWSTEVLSNVYVLLRFFMLHCYVCWHFYFVETNLCKLLYRYCYWRSHYQEGEVEIPLSREGGLKSHYQEGEGWDPIIKRGRVEIPLSRGEGLGFHYQEEEGWDSINLFNPTTFVCLSQVKNYISNIICCDLLCVQWLEIRWMIVCFVNINSETVYIFFDNVTGVKTFANILQS
jgi:hypothetical protein